jgi:putative Mg2+ transporter-C (MgtC) family protein
MSHEPSTVDLALRIALAIFLGAGIGLERQWRLRTAGIRTNALVAVGASLFVIVGSVGLGTGAGADPTRVAAQVVSGIGFLGAGVIIREGLSVRGVTTAATLWCAAAVGSLAGAGQPLTALMGSLAIVVTNTGLRPLSRLVNRKTHAQQSTSGPADCLNFVLEVVTTEKSESRVKALVLQSVSRPELSLTSLHISSAKDSKVTVVASVTADSAEDTQLLERAVQHISLDPKVTSSRWWPDGDDD